MSEEEQFICRQTRGAFGDKTFADESAPENQPRDRAFHVKHLRLEVTPDLAAKAVAGTATPTVTPTNGGLRKDGPVAGDLTIKGGPRRGAGPAHAGRRRAMGAALPAGVRA